MANGTEITQLLFDLTARDNASKTLAKAGVQLAALGVAAVKFGSDSIAAYKDAEASQAKLELAYRKFPALADTNIDKLRELNSELQKKTIYDDDDTAAAQAQLAMYKLTGQQIATLTPLVQDYASATGKDLTTASNDLGKALLGQGRALKEIGVQFTDTGTVAGNLTELTDALREQVGGFAENEGKTAAGQAAILSNQFGDLQETVGEALMPALEKLVDVGTQALEWFNELPGPVKNATLLIGGVGAAAAIVVPKIVAVKGALIELGVVGKSAAAGLETTAAAETATGVAAAGATGKVGGFLTTLGKGVGVAAGVGAALWVLEKSFEKVGDGVKDAAEAAYAGSDKMAKLQAVTQQLSAFPDTFARLHLGSAFFQSIEHSTDVLAKLGVTASQVYDEAQRGDDQWKKYKQSLLDASDAAGNNGSTTKVLGQNLDAVRDSVLAAADGQKVLGGASRDVVSVHDKLVHLLYDENDAYKSLSSTVEDAYLTQLDAVDAHNKATASITELGKQSKVTSGDVNDAMRDIVRAADAVKKKYGETAQGDAVYRAELDKLRAATAPGSALRKALDSYIAQLDAADKDRHADITYTIYADVKGTIPGLGGLIPKSIISPNARRAGGGPVGAGRSYLVGEKGPEIFQPSVSGYIVPNSQVRGDGSGGSVAAAPVTLVTQLVVDGQVLGEVMRKWVQGKGGDPVRALAS